MNKIYQFLAGKTDSASGWLPLWMHLKDTAETMGYLASYWLPDAVRTQLETDIPAERLVSAVMFLGAVHDIGKATYIFQRNIMRNLPAAAQRLCARIDLTDVPLEQPDATSHAKASEAILLELGCPHGLASVAGAHHGKTQNRDVVRQLEYYTKNYRGEEKEAWTNIWQEIFERALEESGMGMEQLQQLSRISIESQVLLTGLLIMADWISSNTGYFPTILQEELGSETLYPERAEQAWEKLSLTEAWEPQFFHMNDDAFSCEFGFKPNAVQRAMLDEAYMIKPKDCVMKGGRRERTAERNNISPIKAKGAML